MNHRVISSILRHDSKQSTYKVALLRAINDIVLAYPDVGLQGRDVAVPLRMVAEAWISYFWPFVDKNNPVYQGVRSVSPRPKQDIAFRAHLSNLRSAWEAVYGPSGPSGGWHIVEQMRVARLRQAYPRDLTQRYDQTLKKVQSALKMPIRYAGSEKSRLFGDPQPAGELQASQHLPGAGPRDECLLIPAGLWASFHQVSLWVEALCIHEWSLLTERFMDDGDFDRGRAYVLLTERPDNRLPLDWERNQVGVLMMEGVRFSCPWTGATLSPTHFDMDHIVPVSVYPFHELWNLVPSDPSFNRWSKGARLPSEATFHRAAQRLSAVYSSYLDSRPLGTALTSEVALRFADATPRPDSIVAAVGRLVNSIGSARNLARF